MSRPSTVDAWRDNEAPADSEFLNLAKVTFDGEDTLITPFDTLIDILPAHDGTYVVEHVRMTREVFEALPEFPG